MNNNTYFTQSAQAACYAKLSDIVTDADAIQTASGWDLYHDDEYLGFCLDGELAELELSQTGVSFHRFPFRGFGRMLEASESIKEGGTPFLVHSETAYGKTSTLSFAIKCS